MTQIVLASASEARQTMLRNAGISFTVQAARVDETAIRKSLEADGATPRDIADTLAEFKARKVGEKTGPGLIIGCDQVMEFKGTILGKPRTRNEAYQQLSMLSGARHKLISAVVIYEDQKPVWRTIDEVRLTMHQLSDNYIESYLSRNWPGVSDSVGAYKLEEEGARLFLRVDGDYFTVLGLPLLDLCAYLVNRGVIEG